MKKERGFTLIELLAVIVILGIILLIATPIILNVIEDSKQKAFEISANNIIRTAELEYWNSTLEGPPKTSEYKFENGKPVGKSLEFNGENPKSGTILVDIFGNVAMAVYSGTWCAIKNYSDVKVKIEKLSEEDCVLEVSEYALVDFIDVKASDAGFYVEETENYERGNYAIALSIDGEVYVRGYGYIGLIDGLSNEKDFKKIESLSNIQKIYISGDLMFALSETGELYAWGNELEIYIPTIIASNVKELYAHYSHDQFYILNDEGTVKFFGDNYYGGLVGEDYYESPILVPGLENVKELMIPELYGGAGYSGKYALLNDGTVKTWGTNIAGAPADGTDSGKPYALTPKLIPNLNNVKKLYSNGDSTYALIDDGTVKVWGYNNRYQLGLGHNNFQTLPAVSNISDSQNIKDIQLGSRVAVILKNNGQVLAIGNNISYLDLKDEPGNLIIPTLLAVNNIDSIFIDSSNYYDFLERLILIDKSGSMYYSGFKYIDYDDLYININLPSEYQQYQSIATCIKNNFTELFKLYNTVSSTENFSPHCFNNYEENPFELFGRIVYEYSENNVNDFTDTIKKFGKFGNITQFKFGVGLSNNKIFNFTSYIAVA